MEFKKQTDEHGEGKKKIRNREGIRDSTLQKKLRVNGGKWVRDGLNWVMGIKEYSCDETRVLYVNDESLNSAETSIALNVNQNLN